MKKDTSSKQLLSTLDIPQAVPAAQGADFSHAVATYKPSTFDVSDLPEKLPVFDKSGRFKRYVTPGAIKASRASGRRVMSMPLMPSQDFSVPSTPKPFQYKDPGSLDTPSSPVKFPTLPMKFPVSPAKDLPPRPTISPRQPQMPGTAHSPASAARHSQPLFAPKFPPPVPQKDSQKRTVSMFTMPRIMDDIFADSTSPESSCATPDHHDTLQNDPSTPQHHSQHDFAYQHQPAESNTDHNTYQQYTYQKQDPNLDQHGSISIQHHNYHQDNDPLEPVSPQNSTSSADLEAIYRCYGSNFYSPDFHIPKHLVIDDDDDSLFADAISNNSSTTPDTKSLSVSMTSSYPSVCSKESLEQTKSTENPNIPSAASDTSSILPDNFEYRETFDLKDDPQIGVFNDNMSFKDSLFSGLDSDIETEIQKLRNPNRTVSVPVFANSYISATTTTINTNKELPPPPKDSTQELTQGSQLNIRKVRNLKSYRNKTDRHSIISSAQSNASLCTKSSGLSSAKAEMQSFVRQRPYSYCLDGGADYSFSKFGVTSAMLNPKGPKGAPLAHCRASSITPASHTRSMSSTLPQKAFSGAIESGSRVSLVTPSLKSQTYKPRLEEPFTPKTPEIDEPFKTPHLQQAPQLDVKKTRKLTYTPALCNNRSVSAVNMPSQSGSGDSVRDTKNRVQSANMPSRQSPKEAMIKNSISQYVVAKKSTPIQEKTLPKTPERENRFGKRSSYIFGK